MTCSIKHSKDLKSNYFSKKSIRVEHFREGNFYRNMIKKKIYNKLFYNK